jgi:hypothetical protein
VTATRIVLAGAAGWLVAAAIVATPWAAPSQGGADSRGAPSLFRTSDACIACHNGLTDASGEDVSFGNDWRATMMANSARDPYWQAAVRRELLDHPGARQDIENECAACHMPMARVEAKTAGYPGAVFAHLPIGQRTDPMDRLAADGVSCTVCHQIQPDNFGERSSFVGGFLVDTRRPPGERRIFGPFEIDAGLATVMRSASAFQPAAASHLQQSEMCATCHTLYTHALSPEGAVVGELPEQVPYQEWLHSAYREERSCQSCHMPVVETPVAITSVLGEPRSGVKRHVFTGGNFFMLNMLNRYRDELGVEALPHELDAAAARTVDFLQSKTATISIERTEVAGERLRVDVRVVNLAGHKLPTAYPSRRVWIHLAVRDGTGGTVFESGALAATGRIEGNANDRDPTRYEPHHREIDRADRVQIYEAIMVDQGGRVTTGLLSGVRFVKDNRLLPRGFEKATADDDIVVRGEAAEDPDFAAGNDRVQYLVDLAGSTGPFRIEAQLWFQPIAYRWAENLREYDAPETRRFNVYYESMAAESAVVLARDAAILEVR